MQICIDELWGTICGDSGWNREEAAVTCRQLGFSPLGKLCVHLALVSKELD